MCYPKWYISSPPKPMPLPLKQPNSSSTISSDSMDYPRPSFPIETPSSPVDSGKPFSRLLESNSQCPQLSILKLMDKQNEPTGPWKICYGRCVRVDYVCVVEWAMWME